MKIRRSLAILLVFILSLSGCPDDGLKIIMGSDEPFGENLRAASTSQLRRVASRLSVMTLAVAISREGRGAFDNYLPAVRRGVINYYNTPAGRHATFSRCNLGDGVVIDGEGELKWVGAGLSGDRNTITKIVWEGTLKAVIDEVAAVQINDFIIDPLAFTVNDKIDPAEFAFAAGDTLDQMQLDSLTVSLQGEIFTVTDGTLPAQVFETTGMSTNSIPNPDNSLSVLTEADVKRIAYHGAMILVRFLVNETLEVGRGDHTHELDCGTSAVTVKADNTPHIDNTWNQCDIGLGLFIDGTFSLDWENLDYNSGTLPMVVEGDLRIGGGIPVIVIKRLEWTLIGANDLPGRIAALGVPWRI